MMGGGEPFYPVINNNDGNEITKTQHNCIYLDENDYNDVNGDTCYKLIIPIYDINVDSYNEHYQSNVYRYSFNIDSSVAIKVNNLIKSAIINLIVINGSPFDYTKDDRLTLSINNNGNVTYTINNNV